MIREFESLYEMMEAIPDEQTAVDHFRAIRWKNGAFCPYCGATRVYHFSDGRSHKCGECRKRFSIKVGTIFEDSKIPLRKWMLAIWMITAHKKGVASTQLARDIKVTQKSAWFMLHRLRHAIRTRSFNRPLDGMVEVDETFVGGKAKNKHASKREPGTQGGKGKVVVFGMLERNGELRTVQIPDLRIRSVHGEIGRNVKPGAVVLTDEHTSYNGLEGRYSHHAVNHSAGEYVRKFFVHTNGIEGVWALFKRQIVGTHHWLSRKHLGRYLHEMTWRYNLRDVEDGFRLNALLAQAHGRLTYKALIS